MLRDDFDGFLVFVPLLCQRQKSLVVASRLNFGLLLLDNEVEVGNQGVVVRNQGVIFQKHAEFGCGTTDDLSLLFIFFHTPLVLCDSSLLQCNIISVVAQLLLDSVIYHSDCFFDELIENVKMLLPVMATVCAVHAA